MLIEGGVAGCNGVSGSGAKALVGERSRSNVKAAGQGRVEGWTRVSADMCIDMGMDMCIDMRWACANAFATYRWGSSRPRRSF